jgi:hypothetical protein
MKLPSKVPPVRSYQTQFRTNETPLSEGGLWLNGRKDGIDWADVLVKNGRAYGEITRMTAREKRVEQSGLGAGAAAGAAEGDYDDPTAVLVGKWGRNQYARARVFSRKQTNKYFQEVEIRLRSSMKPHWCDGYEVFFRPLKTGEGYAEIVRWNGKIGDFTSLKKLVGKQYGVEDGDLIEASIVGNELKGYINGREVISATDGKIKAGSPGIGFNFFVGRTNVDHGLTSFEVYTYDD